MSTFESRDFYGGAIKGVIPSGWLDASDLRQIPDHQELFLSPTTLSNLIIEINEYVTPSTACPTITPTPTNKEEIDKAAVQYHLTDLLDIPTGGGGGAHPDQLRTIQPPTRTTLARLPGTNTDSIRAYKGIISLTSSNQRSSGARRREGRESSAPSTPTLAPSITIGGVVSPSFGGALAGSSTAASATTTINTTTTTATTTTTCYYLLVRIEEREADILIFFNVPRTEFEASGDLVGLRREEDIAAETIRGLEAQMEVVEWGLFGSEDS